MSGIMKMKTEIDKPLLFSVGFKHICFQLKSLLMQLVRERRRAKIGQQKSHIASSLC